MIQQSLLPLSLMPKKIPDIVERYDRLLNSLELDAVRLFNQALAASYVNLEKRLADIYPKLEEMGSLTSTRRSLLLMEELKAVAILIDPEMVKPLEQEFADILGQSIETGQRQAAELVEAIVSEDFLKSTAGVPLEAAAFAARDSVKRLSRHSEDFANRATALVAQGLIQGHGVAKIRTALRRELGTTKAKAETIARTEVLAANNTAATETYRANGIGYVQVIATADDRSCALCAARNQNVYEIDKISVPFHPRCRCFLMPWSPTWQRLGLTNDQQAQEFYEKTLEQLPEGTELDTGPGAFEKYQGMTKAPEPVWAPAKGYSGPPPAEDPSIKRRTLKARPDLKPRPDGFPGSIAGLKKVKDLGGSTGAELVEDADGNRFVLKRGANSDHLREEFAADRFYEALGVPVPKGRLYEEQDGPVKLTQFIEGKPLADLKGKERKDAIESLQKGFAVDALLGNWDVIGLDSDNVLVGADGTAYRIDNGGSLRYRAQGALKGKAWDGYPSELWTMRDSKISQSAAEVFSGLNFKAIKGQIQTLNFKKAIETIADKGQREILEKRFSEMERVARIAQVFEDDAWNDEYIDRFAKHSMGLRKAGIVDRMPQMMQKSKPVYILKDENGKEFDSFRGENSITNDLIDYINRSGGQYYWAESYLTGQSGHSWNDEPQAYKYFLSSQRLTPQDSYFWANGIEKAERLYNEISKKAQYSETMTAYHAFSYEVFSNVELPNVDRTTQTATLIRTERKYVVQDLNGMKVGDTKIIKKGPAESTSLVKTTIVEGSEVTTQVVPIHRIVASYLPSRFKDSDSDALLGDNENEVLAMMEGIPTYYKRAGRSNY